MSKQENNFNINNIPSRDGLDNSGTQGYDSLSDDAYNGPAIPFLQPESDQHINTPATIKQSEIKGPKIIFDLIIREKLAHAIVIKQDNNYHINLNGEDLGRFEKDVEGKVHYFPQSKFGGNEIEYYFKPIEEKLKELNK